MASIIDNPWNVGIARAVEVGHHLAEVLLRRQHGRRPITLLGFSLGARVIYHCLLEMSKRPDAYGIVEDVYLLGAPVAGTSSEWALVCRVVGGRLVNGYSSSDWLLKFLYRTMSAQLSIAGTAPVRGVVNFDLTHIVKGHMDYRRKLRECLVAVGCPVTPHRDDTIASLLNEVVDSPMTHVECKPPALKGTGRVKSRRSVYTVFAVSPSPPKLLCPLFKSSSLNTLRTAPTPKQKLRARHESYTRDL
jgi:hypothetical protein